MNGKKCDVLIENIVFDDLKTGLKQTDQKSFNVWADAGNKEVIKSVSGVTHVFNVTSDVEYHVYIDPRYDREYIKREIEAAILERGVIS